MSGPRTWDGQFVPLGDGRVECPEPRRRIQERLDGQQIAMLHVIPEPGPTGSPVLGVEMTSGARVVIMAGRDRNSRTWNCRLLLAWMPAQKVWTPQMARHFGHGRLIEAGDPPPEALERWLEGAVVCGIRNIREPTPTGGECLVIELSDGKPLSLWLAAEVSVQAPFTADLIAQVRRPSTGRRLVQLSGVP